VLERGLRKSIETGQPADIECAGGIHLMRCRFTPEMKSSAASISVTRSAEGCRQTAGTGGKYGVSVEELRREAETYQTRPPFIIELAKNRLLVARD